MFMGFLLGMANDTFTYNETSLFGAMVCADSLHRPVLIRWLITFQCFLHIVGKHVDQSQWFPMGDFITNATCSFIQNEHIIHCKMAPIPVLESGKFCM